LKWFGITSKEGINMLDILGKRYIFFAISALLILPGLIVMAILGLPSRLTSRAAPAGYQL
jgi:hypothetical protein